MPPTSSAVYSSSQYYQPNSFLHLQHTPGKELVCVDFQKRKQVEIAKKNTVRIDKCKGDDKEDVCVHVQLNNLNHMYSAPEALFGDE